MSCRGCACLGVVCWARGPLLALLLWELPLSAPCGLAGKGGRQLRAEEKKDKHNESVLTWIGKKMVASLVLNGGLYLKSLPQSVHAVVSSWPQHLESQCALLSKPNLFLEENNYFFCICQNKSYGLQPNAKATFLCLECSGLGEELVISWGSQHVDPVGAMACFLSCYSR